jgi:hypothetical protein
MLRHKQTWMHKASSWPSSHPHTYTHPASRTCDILFNYGACWIVQHLCFLQAVPRQWLVPAHADDLQIPQQLVPAHEVHPGMPIAWFAVAPEVTLRKSLYKCGHTATFPHFPTQRALYTNTHRQSLIHSTWTHAYIHRSLDR